MRKFLLFGMIPALLIPLLLCGCDPEAREARRQEKLARENDPQYDLKVYYRDHFFNPYYYWIEDQLPVAKTLKPYDTEGIYEYFDALLYAKDRWSWMIDGPTFVSSETGQMEGTYGVALSQPIEYYNDYAVKIAYVYPGSAFAEQGVTRGWTLTHIAGQTTDQLIRQGRFNQAFTTSPQSFTLEDLDGVPHSFIATATDLSVSPVLKTAVFTSEDILGLNEPVGYLNYLSFKANFIDEIDKAMEVFYNMGVSYLILDLRYNGGGDSRCSQRMVDYLAPKSAVGQVYVRRTHNSILSDYDVATKVAGTAKSLNLKRLYVISGEGTASASEMVTNGLRPLMDLQMVGDTTYGKPNGMYVMCYPDTKAAQARYDKGDYSGLEWVFLPICFYNMNGRGESIPDTGFVPDNYRPDDLYHDFDAAEDNIRACLLHIVTGTYPDLPATVPEVRSMRGGVRLPTEPQRDPHYGQYWVWSHPALQQE